MFLSYAQSFKSWGRLRLSLFGYASGKCQVTFNASQLSLPQDKSLGVSQTHRRAI
jgi:hypothetical protein